MVGDIKYRDINDGKITSEDQAIVSPYGSRRASSTVSA